MAQSVVECKATTTLESGEKVETVVNLELGDNLEGAVAKYGDELIFDHFVRSSKVRAQATIRSLVAAGKSQAEIEEFFKTWRPDTTRARTKDPVASITKNFGNLTVDQKKELLAALKSMATS